MIKRRVKIVNDLGLHARAASLFVKTAQGFSSHIEVSRNRVAANGKNIMSVMLLAAAKNSMITLEVHGDDEVEAMEALTLLVKDRFGEER